MLFLHPYQFCGCYCAYRTTRVAALRSLVLLRTPVGSFSQLGRYVGLLCPGTLPSATSEIPGATAHPSGLRFPNYSIQSCALVNLSSSFTSLSSRNAAPHPRSCVILLRMLLRIPTEFGLLFPGTLSFMCFLRSLVLLRTLEGSLLRMLLRKPTGFGLNSRHTFLHVSSLLTPWCYCAPWDLF